MSRELSIYDLLREAHKSVKKIWREYPELVGAEDEDEGAIDAVDQTLYLAEGYFVRETWKEATMTWREAAKKRCEAAKYGPQAIANVFAAARTDLPRALELLERCEEAVKIGLRFAPAGAEACLVCDNDETQPDGGHDPACPIHKMRSVLADLNAEEKP